MINMKCSDLQIGDWVLIKSLFGGYHTTSIKIAAVHQKKIGYHKVSDKLNWVRIGLLEPIPLTSKILERNGWVYNNEDEKFFPQTWVSGELLLQSANDFGYHIVVTSDYDDEDTNGTPFVIRYVHELQHILRLCGLNDLADNLKLEE